jgi:hypothetical protein
MNWLDPEWFALRSLQTEWGRQNWRTHMLRVATVCAVLVFCASPMTLSTAFYIDSVGLDVFLALLELQLLVGAILIYQTYLKPVAQPARWWFARRWLFARVFVLKQSVSFPPT